MPNIYPTYGITESDQEKLNQIQWGLVGGHHTICPKCNAHGYYLTPDENGHACEMCMQSGIVKRPTEH